jgi:RNA polymerase sigma-70 factor (ECF subfamily)
LSSVEARADAGLDALDEREYRQLLTRRGLELIRPDFSDATWRAFEMVTQDGRSAKEVAESLHLSPNAVYLARNRVLTRLREELEGFLD